MVIFRVPVAATAAGYDYILHALRCYWDFGQSAISGLGVRSVLSVSDVVGTPVLRITLENHGIPD
jgi:hypothetical protein